MPITCESAYSSERQNGLGLLPIQPGCSRTRQQCTGLFDGLRRGPRYVEDYVTVKRDDRNVENELQIYYRIYNPSYLHSNESPPLVVVHGGPSLPSTYLYPLANQIPTTRTVIFYDQLGCGKSCQPNEKEFYSINNSVNDLHNLIVHFGLNTFHLFGHSFGGILAFEYVKHTLTGSSSTLPKCLSLVLANAPCNMRISLEECSRLEKEIELEMLKDMQRSEEENLSLSLAIKQKLRNRNECRTRVVPEALTNAIRERGVVTSWSGPEAISEYVASLPHSDSPSSTAAIAIDMPPVLLIRGEYDFITEKCTKGWEQIFTRGSDFRGTAYREEVIKNCSHYCHLEDEENFANLVKKHCFIHDY